MGNNVTATAANIKPSDIYAYVDKAQVWLKQPLSKTDLKWLRQQCGQGGLHVVGQQPRFDRSLKQRLQLYQPSTEAIQSLSTKDHYLNYLELSLDWVFHSEEERDQAYEFVSRYHVKKWHGKQEVKFAGTGKVTRYTGPRRAPNVMVTYRDHHSKVTGEVYCVHFDWRVRGPALSRLTRPKDRFFSLRDVNVMDHRQFWQQRLLFYTVKARELGRQYRYKVEGRQRRGLILFYKQFAYDVDKRCGDQMIRLCQSTQRIIDQYKKQIEVRSCLNPVEGPHLLPRNRGLQTEEIGSFQDQKGLETENPSCWHKS